ncbi:hypothetical protein Dimus_022706, partial [Dionaea muscipula]
KLLSPPRGTALAHLSGFLVGTPFPNFFLPSSLLYVASPPSSHSEYVRSRMLHARLGRVRRRRALLVLLARSLFFFVRRRIALAIVRARLAAATRLRAGERSGCHATIDRDDLRRGRRYRSRSATSLRPADDEDRCTSALEKTAAADIRRG